MSLPVGPCWSVAITSSGLLSSVLQADGHWDCEQEVDQMSPCFSHILPLPKGTASTEGEVQVLPCETRGLS